MHCASEKTVDKSADPRVAQGPDRGRTVSQRGVLDEVGEEVGELVEQDAAEGRSLAQANVHEIYAQHVCTKVYGL